ncbi:MAG: MBL fold metallo-hydrolase [Agathobacter sp.]|nr:MBL fold metallo-hydrolase [Agathobacter sp.]
MHKMLRTFLPIGHGGFYTELFQLDNGEKINVVYDCGATSKKLLESHIEHHFQKDEVIHALFISHLHDDHINGIPKLLKHCKVKNIFFPLLTEREHTLSALYNAVNSKDEFSIKFALDPSGTLLSQAGAEETMLYAVKELDENGDSKQISNEISNDFSMERSRQRIFQSGEDAAGIILGACAKATSSFDWIFRPFNFKHLNRLKALESALEDEFGETLNNDELKEIWEKNDATEMGRVKKVYAMWKGHNIYSMTLYSGLKASSCNQYLAPTYRWCYYPIKGFGYYIKEVGCLYTGDYEAKKPDEWKELSDAYRDVWDYIGCVQIPHHGSIHNYHDKFADIDAFFMVSAKYGDIKHPASYVIKHLLLNDRPLFVVTEKKISRIDLRVDIP